MNCQQIDKYIYEFCDKQLTPQMQDGIQAHLDQCESCRDKVAAAGREGNLLRSLEIIPTLQPEFTGQVISLIQKRYNNRSASILAVHASRHPQQVRWWWGAASAAVLILALYSLPLLEHPMSSRLAGQNDQAGLHTETLPAALNNVPENVPEKNPAPETPQAGEPVEETAGQSRQVAVQDVQTPVSPKDTLLPDASQPAPDARSFSYAAPADQIMKSPNYTSNPNRGVELSTLHPANLPPEYTLQAVVSNSDRDITFVYQNQATQQELNLRLTVVDHQINSAEIAGSSDELLLKSASPARTEGSGGPSPPKTVLINSFHSEMNYDQQLYQLVVSGNLSTEELAVIANSLQLEEGIQGVKAKNP